MFLLSSVHTLDDVALRLYPTREAAIADKPQWSPAAVDSTFIGFRLQAFDTDGMPRSEEFFDPED